LKETEENWNKNANFSFVPKAISYNPLILEKLNAIPAHDKLILNPSEEMEDLIIKQLFLIVKEIHLSKGTEKADFKSSYDQYFAKTIKRLENVDFMFKSFNQDKIKINEKFYRNPLVVLKENEENIKSIFAKKFRFIHGDIQLCNTLIDQNNKLYVIDPRGYFGNRKLFGDPIYYNDILVSNRVHSNQISSRYLNSSDPKEKLSKEVNYCKQKHLETFNV